MLYKYKVSLVMLLQRLGRISVSVSDIYTEDDDDEEAVVMIEFKIVYYITSYDIAIIVKVIILSVFTVGF